MATTLRNLKLAEAQVEPVERVAERKFPALHAARELLADLVSDRVALVGAIGFLIVLLLAATAPYIADKYTAQSLRLRLSPPALTIEGEFNYHYLLGTDQLGRPILDRIIHGPAAGAD